ncbi:MAG: tagaturonate epimerase family protein [Ktedonobacteraceae bacterium]
MADFGADPTVTKLPGLHFLTPSITRHEGALYALVEMGKGERRLAIEAPTSALHLLTDFAGESYISNGQTLLLAPLTAENAAALRKHLSWLRPSVQGLRTTVGLGDRLGLATPGHLQAVRAAGGSLIPFPTQQSIREMKRTGRTPQQVMDDAMWGVFAEGWHTGVGADADHLKTPADIDYCAAVGYTFYTFDPGEYVDSEVEQASGHTLRARFDELPWEELEDNARSLAQRYLAAPTSCEGYVISFDEQSLMRAAVKYGRAVAHVVRMYNHLAQTAPAGSWEVEVSVDETATPTTHAEHVYIASELRRLDVRWISLAPRYIGQFEKGVDYIGNIKAFEADIAVHAAIARTLGPYKLSLHSGSDKFSIYEPAVRQTRGQIHLKTAGTSYLEALRTISRLEPDLMRAIYECAREHYTADRASYHVSAELTRAPESASLIDAALPTLLDQFDAREILHVTFGTILTLRTDDGRFLFYDRIMALLRTHPGAYAADLKAHFLRHLRSFAAWSAR